MKNVLRLAAATGMLALASWVVPGTAPLHAATCPGGYGDCAVLAGRGCSPPGSRVNCCDHTDIGVCTCSSNGHYICAV